MAFKSVDTLLLTLDTVSKNYKHILRKPRFLYMKRACFCSKNDEDDTTHSTGEAKVKSLLKSSSPLRLSALEIEKNMWATYPYPEGTVFKNMESDSPDESEKTDDFASKSVILFPGQGNQFVGMGKNLMSYPMASEMFQAANSILKYDLRKICFEGPEKTLSDTKFCQPATFVCSLALLEKLKIEKPWAISNCIATCGYSLGELTALVFAGCINFEAGLKLVNFRARVMAECCKKTEGGMLTIFTGPRCKLGVAFSDAIDHCKGQGIVDPICATATYLYPNCKVIAGNMEALKFLIDNAKKYWIRKHSLLPVSGAFHTTLMKEAGEEFKNKIQQLEFNKPIIKVFSNVTGLSYRNEKDIKKLLPKQIFLPVRWEQTIQNLFHFTKEYPFIFECGPGSSLTAIVKKVNSKAGQTCFSVKL